MKATMLLGAEEDLEAAFNYYETQRPQLGTEMLDEFRRGVDLILEFPDGWQALDEKFRRYRLHRFPFAIIYQISDDRQQAIIHAVMHTGQKPGFWPVNRPR